MIIPVSAERGSGEYARSKEIAAAVMRRWPDAEIQFVLNKHACYAANVSFPTTWLPSSATFHPRRVAQLIREFQPTVVLFDNAGRTEQLKAARSMGARIIYVSSRPRQRRKAFRLRWMKLIDEHWIAYPEFIAGSLSTIERLKLTLLERPAVRYMDTIMPDVDGIACDRIIARRGLRCDDFILVVPGGGTGHPGAENAPRTMAVAAARLAARGQNVVLLGGSELKVPRPPTLHYESHVPMAELTALIKNARLVVTNGGDTLLQALTCQRPCLAIAVARDQARRIERCHAEGLISRSALDSDEIERAALALLNDDDRRVRQTVLLRKWGLANGLGAAVETISALTVA